MIVQSIRFAFEPADAGEMQSIMLELRDASRKEPGVVSFDVGRGLDDPGVFALWEVYRDTLALDAHAKTEHFKRLVLGQILTRAKERSVERVELL